MPDKSIWQGFEKFFGIGRSDSGSKSTMAHLCPAGLHQIDPHWIEQGIKCPYCEAARGFDQQSPREATPPPRQQTAAPPPPASSDSSRRRTVFDDGAANSGGGAQASPPPPPVGASSRARTVVDSAPFESSGGGSDVRHVGGGRRLQGVLTTYTWSPNGELFTIRDGRNYVGSGVVSADNNAPCEVQIPNDGRMSGAHFLILYQGGRPVISDNLSTNGTYVNNQLIDGRGTELHDNAIIKAGDTVFVFQKIHRSDASSAPLPPRDNMGPPPPPEPPPWSPRGQTEVR